MFGIRNALKFPSYLKNIRIFGTENAYQFLELYQKDTCLAYAYRNLKLSQEDMSGVERVHIFLKKPQKDIYLTEEVHRQASQSISGKL
jgi:hypothetical protein